MSGLAIGKAIYYILSGNTAVKNYLGNKIFPIQAPDETLVPFIVYERRSLNARYTKDLLLNDECSVVINIVTDNYSENIDIADAVRTALESKVGLFNGINIYQSHLSSVSEDYGVDGFITTLEFAIICK